MTIALNGSDLTVTQVIGVARRGEAVSIAQSAWQEMRDSREIVITRCVGRAEKRRQSLIADLVAAEAVDAGYARQRGDGVGQRGINGGMAIGPGITRRPHK